jgi:hypothetical protein
MSDNDRGSGGPTGPRNPEDPEARVRRIRRPGAEGITTYHGPVTHEVRGGNGVQVVVFRGAEESDVLHAAAEWMAGHYYAVILAIGWHSEHVHEDDSVPAWRLDLAVDMGNYQ